MSNGRKGPGRPSLPKSERLANRVNVRLTDEELKRLTHYLEANGLEQSEVIRLAILEFLSAKDGQGGDE